MDAVTLAQVVDLLNKVGKNNDASGTTTLFSRLQQLSDYVDTLETKLGLNSDASGTTTVFARLAQIAAFVDQVEGYTDAVEGTLSTVNTNVNTVSANVNTANTNITANSTKIGASTDASGTSTLFALLKKLDAKASGVNIDKSLCIPFASPASSTAIAATTSYQTVYSYTGKGYLDHAFILSNATSHNYIRVTIDGVVKFEGSVYQNSGVYAGIINKREVNATYDGGGMSLYAPVIYATPSYMRISETNMVAVDYPYTTNQLTSAKGYAHYASDSIYFNSSILIEIRSAVNSNVNFNYQGGKI